MSGPLFVLCKNGCWRQRRRNTKFWPEKVFSTNNPPPPPHLSSQNDQRDVGIILSHRRWVEPPPPPPQRHGRSGTPALNPPSRHGGQGGGGRGVGKMGLRVTPPSPAEQFSSRPTGKSTPPFSPAPPPPPALRLRPRVPHDHRPPEVRQSGALSESLLCPELGSSHRPSGSRHRPVRGLLCVPGRSPGGRAHLLLRSLRYKSVRHDRVQVRLGQVLGVCAVLFAPGGLRGLAVVGPAQRLSLEMAQNDRCRVCAVADVHKCRSAEGPADLFVRLRTGRQWRIAAPLVSASLAESRVLVPSRPPPPPGPCRGGGGRGSLWASGGRAFRGPGVRR